MQIFLFRHTIFGEYTDNREKPDTVHRVGIITEGNTLVRFPSIKIAVYAKASGRCAVLLVQEAADIAVAAARACGRGIRAAGRLLLGLPAAETVTVRIPGLLRPLTLRLRLPCTVRTAFDRGAVRLGAACRRFFGRSLWGYPLWFLPPAAGILLLSSAYLAGPVLFPDTVARIVFSADLPDFIASAGGIDNREVVRLSMISVPEDLFLDLPEDAPRRIAFSLYEVVKGDTISGIAQRFDLKQDTIISFNQVERARQLSIGTVLRIPNKDGLLHTATGSETLAKIAEKYEVTLEGLLQDNPGTPDLPEPDRELFVAGGRLSSVELRRVWGELFRYPTRGWISSSFGYRPDPFSGIRKFHNGLDIANFTGTSIIAALDGRVIATGYNESAGNFVMMSHVSGYQSLYMHMDAIQVRKGQWVVEGQKIGTMGNTGYSTGSHLHFSIFRWGKPINPLTLMN